MSGSGEGKDLKKLLEQVANDPEKLAAMLEQLKTQKNIQRKQADNIDGVHKFWETQPVPQRKPAPFPT